MKKLLALTIALFSFFYSNTQQCHYVFEYSNKILWTEVCGITIAPHIIFFPKGEQPWYLDYFGNVKKFK